MQPIGGRGARRHNAGSWTARPSRRADPRRPASGGRADGQRGDPYGLEHEAQPVDAAVSPGDVSQPSRLSGQSVHPDGRAAYVRDRRDDPEEPDADDVAGDSRTPSGGVDLRPTETHARVRDHGRPRRSGQEADGEDDRRRCGRARPLRDEPAHCREHQQRAPGSRGRLQVPMTPATRRLPPAASQSTDAAVDVAAREMPSIDQANPIDQTPTARPAVTTRTAKAIRATDASIASPSSHRQRTRNQGQHRSIGRSRSRERTDA